MTHKEVITALRSTPSRSKRELFDTAADMIERMTQSRTVVSNADRIRSLSDEELAEILYKFGELDGGDIFCRNKQECNEMLEADRDIPCGMCIACAIEWLRQPAETN